MQKKIKVYIQPHFGGIYTLIININQIGLHNLLATIEK